MLAGYGERDAGDPSGQIFALPRVVAGGAPDKNSFSSTRSALSTA